MLAARGVRLRANHYFWGGCLAIGALALLTISRLAIAEKSDPGNSTGGANAAQLDVEIQHLHEELASTREELREATSHRGEERLAQRGDGPPHREDPPDYRSDNAGAKTSDGKQIDTDAWRSLDKELAHKWRRGPGPHPGMRDGFRGGPPWAHHRGHGRGGPPWAHHHHRGWQHWARHGRHGGPWHWAHRHGHGRGHGWAPRGPDQFGTGPRGGDVMPQIARRLNLLEEKIDALMREVHATREGPDRGGPKHDGPPHDGPPRDGAPRDGPPPR